MLEAVEIAMKSSYVTFHVAVLLNESGLKGGPIELGSIKSDIPEVVGRLRT